MQNVVVDHPTPEHSFSNNFWTSRHINETLNIGDSNETTMQRATKVIRGFVYYITNYENFESHDISMRETHRMTSRKHDFWTKTKIEKNSQENEEHQKAEKNKKLVTKIENNMPKA
jgi:ABC-type proline/glycine betaine transport system ATPase subunit